MKILYKKYPHWEFEIYDLPDNSKMVGHQRLSTVVAFEATEKNLTLMKKHNGLIQEISKLIAHYNNLPYSLNGQRKRLKD